MTPHEPRRNGDRLWVKILNAWPVIVALVSIIAMATTMKNKIDDHEQRINKLETGFQHISDNTDRLVNELLEKR